MGFLPALVIAILVVVSVRMMVGVRAPVQIESSSATPISAATYIPLGVEPGHRLDCDAAGEVMDGPQRTAPLRSPIICALDPAPALIRVVVSYDVDPAGRVTNVAPGEAMPLCIERAIEEALMAWNYCPLTVRGEHRWRYGESIVLSFSRRD